MSENVPQQFDDLEKCVDAILAKVGKNIVFGMPLGLGKPVLLANAIYNRAKKDRSINLKFATAISLEKPKGKSKLESNFLEPFVERQFKGVPDLDYVTDIRNNALPSNVELIEFFFKAGSYLNVPSQQQNYINSNYTHAIRDLLINGVNVVSQCVAKRDFDGETKYSVSCNPDTGIDIVPEMRKLEAKGTPIAVIGEVNKNLPFMHNHAMVEGNLFDMIIDLPGPSYELFGVPNMAITPVDHMIGYNASTLLKDGGTLQVGIGSLGSALVYSTILREEHNPTYKALYNELDLANKYPVVKDIGGVDKFTEGLYGCSEMLVDGFMYLYKAGIIKREVFNDTRLQTLINEGKITTQVSMGTLDALVEADVISEQLRAKDIKYLQEFGILKPDAEFKGGTLVIDGEPVEANLADQAVRNLLESKALGDHLAGGTIMHGGFFLGPTPFYQMLHELTDEEHKKICMTSVGFINHLYDHRYGRQDLKVAQRKDSRFINSAMMATLGGAAISDGLANGKVVSGVGGQYNFVSMAHEMNDSRSVLKLKSTRQSGGQTYSNIMLSYGHITIPRHLRDIYVTEYGVADLLGKTDRDCYIEMIKIADSRFQDELLEVGKKNGKIPSDYQLPEQYRSNTPEKIQAIHHKYNRQGHFAPFPFGCDFTEDELKIGKALKALKAKTATRSGTIKCILNAMKVKQIPSEIEPLIKRMKLDNPTNFKEKLEQKLLAAELLG